MPVLPKSLITFGASLLTARTAVRLRKKMDAIPAQRRVFRHLTERLARTKQGRTDGIESGMNYTKFAGRVPPRTYEQFLPQLQRMKCGEPDVLWPGHCPFYAISPGTTNGRAKNIPVTDGMLRHFRRAGLASLLYYTARTGHAGVFRGRHLYVGGSTTLNLLPEAGPIPTYAGDLSGIAALDFPRWVEKHYYEPGTAIAQITDWPAKVAAIIARTAHRDIALLAGVPSWLPGFASAVLDQARSGQNRPVNLRTFWPNLECLIHGGEPCTPFADELRLACGSGVDFHEVYPTSEGFIAAQDAEAEQGMRLITDAGLFFEFLPLRDFDENRLEHLGPKIVPLAGVRAGLDYVLLLTTPAGLTRYLLGDVVRFTSTEPPRLLYVGRTQLQLNRFGERVSEKEITDTLLTICKPQGWTVVNFHVAPLFTNTITGQTHGRHEWWVELRPGTVTTPTGPVMEEPLDRKLQLLNESYAAKRKAGVLLPPVVRLVMPGIFEQWLRYHRQWDGKHKMPRCRGDREIADELNQLTTFKPDSAQPWGSRTGKSAP